MEFGGKFQCSSNPTSIFSIRNMHLKCRLQNGGHSIWSWDAWFVLFFQCWISVIYNCNLQSLIGIPSHKGLMHILHSNTATPQTASSKQKVVPLANRRNTNNAFPTKYIPTLTKLTFTPYFTLPNPVNWYQSSIHTNDNVVMRYLVWLEFQYPNIVGYM